MTDLTEIPFYRQILDQRNTFRFWHNQFKDDLRYIAVPKCASRTMGVVLNQVPGWDLTMESKEALGRPRMLRRTVHQSEPMSYPNGVVLPKILEPETKCFGIVRHPVDRWVSGVAQCFGELNEDHISQDQATVIAQLMTEDGLEQFVNVGWYERHTHPQNWYYKPYKRYLTLFKIEEMDKVWEFIGIDKPDMNHLNENTIIRRRGKVYESIKKSLEARPDYVEKLLLKYADDLILYNNA